MEQNTKFNILNSTGGIIAALIPLIQFAFGWFPTQLNKIFIDENIIFFTTALTFIFSIFIVILASVNKRLFSFFGKYYYTENFANSSLLVIFIASITFLAIGVRLQEGYHPWWALTQAISYIITIASSVFFIAVYSIDITEKKTKENAGILRARRAISLAIEHDAFQDFPHINFIKSVEATKKIANDSESIDGFLVYVGIQNSSGKYTYYTITTNEDASILKGVENTNIPGK